MTTCSSAWADADLAAWGTAAHAAFWVGMEQPGPWGTKAATQSRLLDPEVGAAIEQWCLDKGGQFLLLQMPGGVETSSSSKRVFVAGNLTGTPWLGSTTIDDAGALVGLLVDTNVALAEVRPPGFERHPAILTVCTNGRRDQCCARSGVGLARSLAEQHPDQIWECSHLGGHRFAPTALLWPTGQVVGRLTERSAGVALQLAERDLVWCCRLRSRSRH